MANTTSPFGKYLKWTIAYAVGLGVVAQIAPFLMIVVAPSDLMFLGGLSGATMYLVLVGILLAPIFAFVAQSAASIWPKATDWLAQVRLAGITFFVLALPFNLETMGFGALVLGLLGGVAGAVAWMVRRPDTDHMPAGD